MHSNFLHFVCVLPCFYGLDAYIRKPRIAVLSKRFKIHGIKDLFLFLSFSIIIPKHAILNYLRSVNVWPNGYKILT